MSYIPGTPTTPLGFTLPDNKASDSHSRSLPWQHDSAHNFETSSPFLHNPSQVPITPQAINPNDLFLSSRTPITPSPLVNFGLSSTSVFASSPIGNGLEVQVLDDSEEEEEVDMGCDRGDDDGTYCEKVEKGALGVTVASNRLQAIALTPSHLSSDPQVSLLPSIPSDIEPKPIASPLLQIPTLPPANSQKSQTKKSRARRSKQKSKTLPVSSATKKTPSVRRMILNEAQASRFRCLPSKATPGDKHAVAEKQKKKMVLPPTSTSPLHPVGVSIPVSSQRSACQRRIAHATLIASPASSFDVESEGSLYVGSPSPSFIELNDHYPPFSPTKPTTSSSKRKVKSFCPVLPKTEGDLPQEKEMPKLKGKASRRFGEGRRSQNQRAQKTYREKVKNRNILVEDFTVKLLCLCKVHAKKGVFHSKVETLKTQFLTELCHMDEAYSQIFVAKLEAPHQEP
ncbi:hypothetical protein CI109_104194 [Kwoniella shandongensis]|uniref:Uncharacterized protein n=1 Tax=Kwoniella shandongensis TaxID=1734106 RepID=A0A5M6C0S2_9TREE|nr:uncharacterized protein CI109_002895 [Kwoniella shandongensis]KAA5528737.1 hypothetical protein CI109_002895 [Kwoniella shandongensis]